jgi:hypothetical protein
VDWLSEHFSGVFLSFFFSVLFCFFDWTRVVRFEVDFPAVLVWVRAICGVCDGGTDILLYVGIASIGYVCAWC